MVMHAIVDAQRAQMAAAQVRQLNMLNAQLHQQMAEQQRQALLADMLFQTEQTARRVKATAKTDPFAACVLAEPWLASVANVRPEMFLAVESKRAWSAAIEAMARATTAARKDPRVGADLQAYENALQERERLERQSASGPRPVDLAALQARHASQVATLAKGPRHRLYFLAAAGACAALPVVLLVGGLVVALIEAGAKTHTQGGSVTATIAMMLAVLAIPIGIGLGVLGLLVPGRYRRAVVESEDGMKWACQNNAAVDAMCAERRAFVADPSRGQILDRLATDHPLLTQTPPPEAYEDAAPSSIVERQTVVTRCQYCGNLTPVDLQGCQHCGAKLK